MEKKGIRKSQTDLVYFKFHMIFLCLAWIVGFLSVWLIFWWFSFSIAGGGGAVLMCFTKAIQDSEPPRGGKHHTKDLLYFFHLILLLDISSVTKKLHRKQRILFAEHFNCCIGRPYITQIKRFDSDKSVVSSVLTFLIQVIKEL